MNPEMVRAFTSMGYRRLVHKDKVRTAWIKPVAHMCFVFQVEQMRWCNMFVDIKGKTSVWVSHAFKPVESAGSYLEQLKDFEGNTRTDVLAGKSEFEFIDLKDALEMELNDLTVT